MLRMPTTIEGQEYLNSGEAAEFMGVSYVTFSRKFKPKLESYEDPTDAKAILFKKADLEQLKVIKPRSQDQ